MPPKIAHGERTVRKLAHEGFVLAQQATPPLAACAALLGGFTRATEQYGEGLVAAWLDEEAAMWRLLKRTSPYSGAPLAAGT